MADAHWLVGRKFPFAEGLRQGTVYPDGYEFCNFHTTYGDTRVRTVVDTRVYLESGYYTSLYVMAPLVIDLQGITDELINSH